MSFENYDPNGVGIKNGNLIGLPFNETSANVVLLPVPWEVTTSYTPGTATGPENIREASVQLDVFDTDVPDAWKIGLFFRPSDEKWLEKNEKLRPIAESYIEFLESNGKVTENSLFQKNLATINSASEALNQWVQQETKTLLDQGKLVGIVGGEHSTPLGFFRTLAERYNEFGVLQIDAHMDLRKAYEGFTYSHASIFYNAMQLPQISKLVQVGIRDFCEEEIEFVRNANQRIEVFYDHQMKTRLFEGATFQAICQDIVKKLPQKVYISFDIDGLDPQLCPHTGTPVPGGLSFEQAMYLLKQVVISGRQIIGFDLCEVNGNFEWDGNVGARVLYKLCNLMAWSNQKNN